MGLKTTIINTKNWDVAECMSAKRFVRYALEEFKNITHMTGLSKKFCDNLTRCQVKKCNLKKAIRRYRHLIIVNRKHSQKAVLENLKQHLGDIL